MLGEGWWMASVAMAIQMNWAWALVALMVGCQSGNEVWKTSCLLLEIHMVYVACIELCPVAVSILSSLNVSLALYFVIFPIFSLWFWFEQPKVITWEQGQSQPTIQLTFELYYFLLQTDGIVWEEQTEWCESRWSQLLLRVNVHAVLDLECTVYL